MRRYPILEFEYPCKRTEFSKMVGRTRVENIARILHDNFGLDAHINPIEANDVDIMVHKDGKLVMVMEVFNWNEFTSYLDKKRKNSVINNLKKYQCPKVLVCSFLSNLKDHIEEIIKNGIYILEIGFQTVPKDYYEWFKEKGLHEDKRPLNKETGEILVEKFRELFAHVCV